MTSSFDVFQATSGGRVHELVEAALSAATEDTTAVERSEMLMELGIELQTQPKTVEHLHAAIVLYDKALDTCPDQHSLLKARIRARKATALYAIPQSAPETLEQALRIFKEVIPTFAAYGTQEELAEAEMNFGLVMQYLGGIGRARMSDAIAAYHRSLQVFSAEKFPVEFAILQNNLATAFLSLPFTDQRAKIKEALAVQCFEDALKVVTLIDQPTEYAMLQNNLGNALQHAASSHPIENRQRAIMAYDEALKVRTRENAPVQYASTLANKAACIRGLPDEPGHIGANARMAKALYTEARDLFIGFGELDKASLLDDIITEIEGEVSPHLG